MIQVDLSKPLKPLGLPYKPRIPSRTLFIYGMNIEASRQKVAADNGYKSWFDYYVAEKLSGIHTWDPRALKFAR